jgi:hypothetical protein
VDERQSTTAAATASTETTSLGRGRLMFRFAVGATDLARARVGAVLSACAAAAPAAPFDATAGPRIDLPHATLGLLSETLRGASRAPALVRVRLSRLAAHARRRAASLDRVGRLVGRLPGVPRAATRLQAWGLAQELRLARWTELGRREQAEGRALAFDALTVLRENMLARVSDDPDVKRVIREESEGIAVTAVGGLRDGTARADNLAEQAVGRLFGRRRARSAR